MDGIALGAALVAGPAVMAVASYQVTKRVTRPEIPADMLCWVCQNKRRMHDHTACFGCWVAHRKAVRGLR